MGVDIMVHVFAFFWLRLRGPGRQPNESYFWLKFSLETKLWSASLEPLIGFLAYLETKPWLKNPIFDKNQKAARKVWFTLSRKNLASYNSPADSARELIKPYKDSYSLVLWNGTKFKFRVLGFSSMTSRLGHFLQFYCIMSSPYQWADFVAQSFLGY